MTRFLISLLPGLLFLWNPADIAKPVYLVENGVPVEHLLAPGEIQQLPLVAGTLELSYDDPLVWTVTDGATIEPQTPRKVWTFPVLDNSTGLAVANPGATDATLTLQLIVPGQTLMAVTTLPAHSQAANWVVSWMGLGAVGPGIVKDIIKFS